MENNYFIPDVEDIRVKYECEIKLPQDVDWIIHDWSKIILNKIHFNPETPFYPLSAKIRTSYLTKQQIEAEGWEQRGDEKYFYKKDYTLIYEFDKNILQIVLKFKVYTEKLFKGTCKDINTFRYIIKLLGI